MKKNHTQQPEPEQDQKQDIVEPEPPEQQDELAEMKHRYLRALADYKNLEQRIFAEKQLVREQTIRHVANTILPFLDNLEQAEAFIKDPGLAMIKKQFTQSLQELGLVEVPLLHTEFDPHTAEAIDTVDGDSDNIITAVLKKAFKLGDTVIRPGQVQVSRKRST